MIFKKKNLTSCGGTLNVAVRKSTTRIVSTHGKIQNKPGPLAPPIKKKTRRKFFRDENINHTWQTTTHTKNNSSFIFLNDLLKKKTRK
jgi:hypothetical protein